MRPAPGITTGSTTTLDMPEGVASQFTPGDAVSLTVLDNGSLVAISDNGGSIISDTKIINFVPYNKKSNLMVKETKKVILKND